MHDSLSQSVAMLLASAQRQVVIVSAFIRSETLEFLLSHVSKGVDISIYARWRIIDIASGASDIAVIDVAERYNANMKVYDMLHAKIYIADDKALIGSANATDAGLGRRQHKSNLEILMETAASCPEIHKVLNILKKQALAPRRFTDKDVQQIKSVASAFSEEEHVNLADSWLPSSLPKAVLQVTRGEDELADDAIKDCYTLGGGVGTSKARMGEIVRSRYIFSVLNDALMNDYHDALPDNKVIQVISNSFSVKTNYAKNKWNILKEWIDMFSDDMYIGKGETSLTELRRGQRLNLDRNLSLITISTTEETIFNFPESHKLGIFTFSQTLDKKNVTTAHKFLWVLSILDILRHRNHNEDSSNEILFADISRSMAEIAIPPLYRFHLQFGQGEGKGADHTKRDLDNIFKDVGLKDDMPIFNAGNMNIQQELENVHRNLERYAPYRWLTPFFGEDLKKLISDSKKKMSDTKKNKAIIKEAQNRFSSESPVPYRIVVKKNKKTFIEFNDAWKKYIVSNMALIHSWAMYKWAKFLEGRNPGVLNIVNKLAMPHGRPPVSDQRDFWNEVLRCKKEQGSEFFCIYSGHSITGDGNYDLDHYIPWSYIGHCHLWNLIPVAKEVNLKKGNKLPADKYLRPFVKAQHDALNVYHAYFSSELQKKWEYLVAAYSEGLSLPEVESVDIGDLPESYEDVMKSTIELAEKSGFTPNWEWDNNRQG